MTAAPEAFRHRQGNTPLLVSMPHVGTHLPADIAAHMTAEARDLPDNDWHVDALYAPVVEELDASVLMAVHPRYVVDLNRPPDDTNLYPGQDTPGLVPVDTFTRTPIYRDGEIPGAAEIAARVERYWRPYHDRLRSALDELVARHGHALLWEAHSIHSFVPRFVTEPLPDLSFGTGGGTSCTAERTARVMPVAEASDFSCVLNGRFQGGYTTRHHGQPEKRIEAIQLELAQRSYMDEDGTREMVTERVVRLRPVLRELLVAFAR